MRWGVPRTDAADRNGRAAKVEARSADAGWLPSSNATPDRKGQGPGVEHRIPVEGHGHRATEEAPKPRDVINARCLEALREMTADGRYVTATAVAEAIGIGEARRRFRFTRWPLAGKVQRETNRFGRCGWRIPAGTVRDGE